MPQLPDIDEQVPGTPDLLRLPTDIYNALVRAGYTGSRYIYETEVQAILKQYNITGTEGNDPTGGGLDLSGLLGGGGGFSTGPSPADLRNLRASFLEVLHQWDLNLDKNMQNLVQMGVNQEWSTTNFMQHVRQTKAYKQQFAGIQRGQSEAAYLYAYEQYRDRMQDIGKKLTTQQFGLLQKRGVDYEEWSARVDALDRVSKDADLFADFGAVLKARGLISGKFTMKDAVNFVRRKSSPQFEKVWEEASFTSGLERAGFQFGEDGDMSRKSLISMLQGFEARNPGAEVENLGDEFYGQLAERVLTLLPASRIANFGLTKSDILELQLGGPRAASIAQTVNQILANAERAKAGPSAKPQAQPTQTGSLSVAGLEEERAQSL